MEPLLDIELNQGVVIMYIVRSMVCERYLIWKYADILLEE